MKYKRQVWESLPYPFLKKKPETNTDLVLPLGIIK